MESVQSLLVSQLTAHAKKIESVIELTRADFLQADFDDFLVYINDANHGILKLCAIFVSLAECIEKLGVRTRAELEQLWSKHYGEPEVKEAVDYLLEAEKSYASFLTEMENKISPGENKLRVKNAAQGGQTLPKDLSLIAMPSGQPKALEECWKGAKFTLFVLLRLLL